MRTVKVILFGLLFSFAGFVMLTVISIMRGGVSGGVSFEASHATGLSAVVGGILEALFSPITLSVIVVAFAAATWLTRQTSKHTSTPR
jgi:hypothetical protein